LTVAILPVILLNTKEALMGEQTKSESSKEQRESILKEIEEKILPKLDRIARKLQAIERILQISKDIEIGLNAISSKLDIISETLSKPIAERKGNIYVGRDKN